MYAHTQKKIVKKERERDGEKEKARINFATVYIGVRM